MKKIFIIIFCLMFSVFSAQSAEIEKKVDKQIEELSKKEFLYSNNNGKKSFKLITGYSGDMENRTWYNKSCSNNCGNNSITSVNFALHIPGSSMIMAFLSCPACGDSMIGNLDLMIALFNKNNTNEPLCYQQVNFMGKDKSYLEYPGIRSVELRKASERGYYAAVKVSGGDGMAVWSSLVFLFIGNNCETIILSRLYEYLTYYEHEEGKICSGKLLNYNFINDHVVDVVTEDPCTGLTENDVKKFHKQYDLKLLLSNSKARIFKP